MDAISEANADVCDAPHLDYGEEQPIHTGTAAGKGSLDMLGVFAEFETNLRKKRQLKGSPGRRLQGSTRAASFRRRRTSA
jgi:DNA invertase Pin-like site-specific DNA recombinase